MKIVFSILLAVFALVSAYITFLFTSSLGETLAMIVAFSFLGFAFDGLKCFLPNIFLKLFTSKDYTKGAIVAFVY